MAALLLVRLAMAHFSPTTAPTSRIFELAEASVAVFSAYADAPDSAEAISALDRWRLEAANVVAALPPNNKSGPDVACALAMIERMGASGRWDEEAPGSELQLASQLAERGWAGLLAAMILVPAWQWQDAPELERVPIWLWNVYARYLFTPPQGFRAVGQASEYPEFYLRRLLELHGLAGRNRGSAAVRSAVEGYLSVANCIPLYFNDASLRQHYDVRGRLLAMFATVCQSDDLTPSSRDGRRLRVGFVNRHFAPQTETYTTLPSFEQLDPEQFEVVLFSCRQTDTPLERYCRTKVSEFHLLPADPIQQVEAVRAAALDIVVFGTNLTAVFNEVTRIALHRVAPLQVVNNSSCVTTGLKEIDVYISGTLAEEAGASENYTERLALLPGPAHAFNYSADAVDATNALTRPDLGVPEDATLFVTASNYYKIIPEMMDCWGELLSRVPNSYLLIHPFNPNWSAQYPIKRFIAVIEGVFARYGIDQSRLVVSTIQFPSRQDVARLLSLGDVYLDTFPFGGVNSIIDPLEAGVPVVAWEGRCFRSRMGTSILRQLGLEQLCVQDRNGYLAICHRLAADSTFRGSIKDTIREAMQRLPLFFDTLAASDAFGELLKASFDELAMQGRQRFRECREIITARPTEDTATVVATATYLNEIGMQDEARSQVLAVLGRHPADPQARRQMATMLMAAGKFQRAVDYLLAAIQSNDLPSEFWRDLSVALGRLGRRGDAIQALETALKIDNKDVESWVMLARIALESCHEEIFRDSLAVLHELAPDDHRVRAMTAQTRRPSGSSQGSG